MVSVQELAEPNHTITWCPGCGDFAILASLKTALSKLGKEPHNTVVVSGIGCSGKLPHFIKTYGFESIHGRSLAAASGIKLANHELTVIDVGGDGDGYGIGTNHFLHTCRRNYDMTYIVHNNQIYGLTTGQTSPTSEKGFKTKSTPEGVIEVPVNPLTLAISQGATFVARGFSGQIPHLVNLIMEGISHKGFALIDVLQPCVTWNKLNTYKYFTERIYKLEDDKSYNPSDRMAAYKMAETWGDKIPIGVFYRENRPTYEDELPQLKSGPLVKKPLDNIDISGILKNYE